MGRESHTRLLKQHKQFSFEKGFLQQYTSIIKPKGYIARDYFIDIGVPEDYARAQNELVIHPA